MPQLRSLDPAFPLDRQLAVDATPVVLVNLVTLDQADEPRFLEAWQNDAAFMKRQPGFISTQLHRAIGDSPTYLNYAVWESTAHYRTAFTHPEFKAGLAAYPSSVVATPQISEAAASRQEGARMRTTASVEGHPVHMMVVHFPMAFLMGSAAFDVAAAVGLAVPARQARWRWTARWKRVSDCAVRIVAAAQAGGRASL